MKKHRVTMAKDPSIVGNERFTLFCHYEYDYIRSNGNMYFTKTFAEKLKKLHRLGLDRNR